MGSEKYYEMMRSYEEMARYHPHDTEYADIFVNYDNTRESLLKELRKISDDIDTQIMRIMCNVKTSGIYFFGEQSVNPDDIFDLFGLQERVAYLIENITLGEPVSEEDYCDTYFRHKTTLSVFFHICG